MHVRRSLGQTLPRLLTLFSILLCLQSGMAFSQTPISPTPAAKPSQHKIHPHHRKHRHAKHVVKVAPIPQPVTPPAPPAPVSPIPPGQQPAVDAVITNSGNQLTIDAKNSSLMQILHQVTLLTGMTVTGLSGDSRVYGRYGPGRVDNTLRKLLNGGPYNYFIVGGDAQHPPTQLEFSISN